MSRGELTCALPGCVKVVEQVPTGKPRRYCCAAHRKIAHRQRRDQAGSVVRAAVEPASVPGVESIELAPVEEPTVILPVERPKPAQGRPKRRAPVPARRLVAEPKGRWFRRSSPPHARRRVRYEVPPAPSQPEWLRPAPPAPPPVFSTPWSGLLPSAMPTEAEEATQPLDVRAPFAAHAQSVQPAELDQPAKVVRPVEAVRPAEIVGHTETSSATQRRAEAAARRAQAARERREAAAALSGAPIPADEVYADDDATLWRRMVLWLRSTRRGEVRTTSGRAAGQMNEALAAAFHSLANNRLRSLLTATGIIAGVAAVILLVALGDGMKENFDKEFSRLANQITITSAKGAVPDGAEPRNLTDRDVKALTDPEQAPDVAAISPAVVGSVVVSVGQAKAKASLVGSVGNYLDLLDRRITAGGWFTDTQIEKGERSVVIGPEALNLLWGPNQPAQSVIGETVRLSHTNFKIQGVLEANGQDDNVVIVPLLSARTHLVGDNGGKVDLIIVKSTSVDTVDDASDEADTILMARHNIRNPASRDFKVQTYTDWIQKSTRSIKFLAIFIVAIAAISLFVGGVGVANIMLVSVTERTREIGIRKAVGAKTTAIMRQFLSEAVVLTGLGGFVGMILGVGLTLLGRQIVPHIDSDLPVPILNVSTVLVAFGVSLAIGVVAGGYPAHRAARLRPIQALRFE